MLTSVDISATQTYIHTCRLHQELIIYNINNIYIYKYIYKCFIKNKYINVLQNQTLPDQDVTSDSDRL